MTSGPDRDFELTDVVEALEEMLTDPRRLELREQKRLTVLASRIIEDDFCNGVVAANVARLFERWRTLPPSQEEPPPRSPKHTPKKEQSVPRSEYDEIDSGPSPAGFHSVEDLMVCPRMFGYRWVLGLCAKKTEPPLARGILGHVGLAHHHLRQMGRKVREPFEAMDAEHETVRWANPEMQPVVAAYIEHYQDEAGTLLAVEEVLRVRIRGELGAHLLTVRLDVLRKIGGKGVIFDHKFVGSVAAKQNGPAYWAQDGQMRTLWLFGHKLMKRRFNLDFGGVTVNLVQTGTTRAYRRIRVPVDGASAQRDHLAALRYWLDRRHELLRRLVGRPFEEWLDVVFAEFPQAPTRGACWSCKGWGRRCAFFELCHGDGRGLIEMGDFLHDERMTVGVREMVAEMNES